MSPSRPEMALASEQASRWRHLHHLSASFLTTTMSLGDMSCKTRDKHATNTVNSFFMTHLLYKLAKRLIFIQLHVGTNYVGFEQNYVRRRSVATSVVAYWLVQLHYNAEVCGSIPRAAM